MKSGLRMNGQKPPALLPGDKIAIWLPSSPVKEVFREKGLMAIRKMGYQPVEVPDSSTGELYFAKSGPKVLADLISFLGDETVKAVWSARGGYGANRLLPLMPKSFAGPPKMIIGSSDVSSLLWYMMDHWGWVVFYGPMAFSTLAKAGTDTANFVSMAEGKKDRIKISGKILIPGQASGIVTGGCLSILNSLVGTAYFPQINSRVILLEDVNERSFRLDRMIWQLANGGIFSRIKGLILGEFPDCFADEREKKYFFARIKNYCQDFDFPVIYDLPFGHGHLIKMLPLGIEIDIDSDTFAGIIIKEKGVKK